MFCACWPSCGVAVLSGSWASRPRSVGLSPFATLVFVTIRTVLRFFGSARFRTSDSSGVTSRLRSLTWIGELADSLGLLSGRAAPTVKESIVHLSVALWLFPPDDGLLCNRQKSEAAMEPRLFHRIVQSVITHRLRKRTSLAGSTEGHPKIAAYGSQRMCRSCGAITSCSKPFCLECGALLLAV